MIVEDDDLLEVVVFLGGMMLTIWEVVVLFDVVEAKLIQRFLTFLIII